MSRRNFGTSTRMIARAAARAERAHQQAQIRQQAATIRDLRNAERQAKADAKEAVRLYLASRVEEAEDLTRAIQEREAAIDGVLANALGKNPAIDLSGTLKSFIAGRFDESRWTIVQPNPDDYVPLRPGFWARLIPGAAGRYDRRVADATRRYETADAVHKQLCQNRVAAYQSFVADEALKRIEVERHNDAVNEMQRGLDSCRHAAVVGYYERVIDRSLQGEPDAISAEIGYSPDSRHLVVDLELPEISTIPEESGFRYVKSGDRIEAVERPLAKRRAIYGLLLSKITLKCVDTIFRGGPSGVVECLTINGMLETIDPATGQQVRICLLSVRVTADIFKTLNLVQVHPEHCLRSLKASVSRAPAELLPVKPLIELDMVDPQFVETLDVMSALDHRPT
jgi:restriction system protein